jgi:alkylglycerol monooxygenase
MLLGSSLFGSKFYMGEVAYIFSMALPVFLVLVLCEKTIGHFINHDTVPWMDAIASAYSGITLTVKLLLGFGVSILSYEFMYERMAVFHIGSSWPVYILAFVLMDFEFYWGHRLHHQVNFLWNYHLIHHNSEEYNLATAVRQPFIGFINFLIFLSLPAVILGISPMMIAAILPIHKFAQVWYHTRLIGKLGILEHFMVTPSQHRVHHALNPEYIDKNFSAVFNIWDRLFGTFQQELPDHPPVYGITRPSRTYNPITINFEHFFLLAKDAWRADNWSDRFSIWFRRTGWRPEGFEEKYPVAKITHPYDFKKFSPQTTPLLLFWSLVQFFVIFFFAIYVLHSFMDIGKQQLFVFAIFILVQICSATELMNRNKLASIYAAVSSAVGIVIYAFDPGWFGTKGYCHVLPFVLLCFFILQPLVAFILSSEEQLSIQTRRA